jgi:alanyl-tRNA synthetase
MVCGRKLGIEGSFLGDVSLAVINVMNDYYPYLNDSKNDVLMILEKEEKLFNQTLNKGFKLFESVVEATKKIIDTETVFKLVDTFGFPFEIILELAKENDLEIDENAF